MNDITRYTYKHDGNPMADAALEIERLPHDGTYYRMGAGGRSVGGVAQAVGGREGGSVSGKRYLTDEALKVAKIYEGDIANLRMRLAAAEEELAEMSMHLEETVAEREGLRRGWKADYEALPPLRAKLTAYETLLREISEEHETKDGPMLGLYIRVLKSRWLHWQDRIDALLADQVKA